MQPSTQTNRGNDFFKSGLRYFRHYCNLISKASL